MHETVSHRSRRLRRRAEGRISCSAARKRPSAAATSTGGTGQCFPGRVGDTPIIGAGTYCTPRVGVSMTGVGERIMALLSAKRLADLVGAGTPLRQAALDVIAGIEAVGSAAGLIALDAAGETVDVRNTTFMAMARRA